MCFHLSWLKYSFCKPMVWICRLNSEFNCDSKKAKHLRRSQDAPFCYLPAWKTTFIYKTCIARGSGFPDYHSHSGHGPTCCWRFMVRHICKGSSTLVIPFSKKVLTDTDWNRLCVKFPTESWPIWSKVKKWPNFDRNCNFNNFTLVSRLTCRIPDEKIEKMEFGSRFSHFLALMYTSKE